jgi:ATP phosphoribosyltransferase
MNYENELRIALPSKGRLREDMDKLFLEKGIVFNNLISDRDYIGSIEGIDNMVVYFLSAKEITNRLDEGSIHIGLTGDDLIQEKIYNFENKISKESKLNFGKAKLVVAVPDLWIDVMTMADLEEVSNIHRNKYSRRLRVATKYKNLTNQFFSKCGVVDYRTVESHGSTESAPFNGFSEIIADITSTGETLRANNLRVLDDGLILESSANIFKSLTADWDQSYNESLESFLIKIA